MLLQKSLLYERNIFENLKVIKGRKDIISIFCIKYKIYKNMLLLSLKKPEIFEKAEKYRLNILLKTVDALKSESSIKIPETLYHSLKYDRYGSKFLQNDRYIQIVKYLQKVLPSYTLNEDMFKDILKHGCIKIFKFLKDVYQTTHPYHIPYSNEELLMSNNIEILQKYYRTNNYEYLYYLEFCLENDNWSSLFYLLKKVPYDLKDTYDDLCYTLSLYGIVQRDWLELSTDLTSVLENFIILKKYKTANFILQRYSSKIWSMKKLMENKKENIVEFILENKNIII